jgi:carbon monoxide dehydrogenase subunit G
MQIANEFQLSLPPDDAYRLLLDLDRVAPCMPGAELGAELDDGAREVKVKVKLGPMRFSYDGTVKIAEQDAAARSAVLVGSARDARTQATAEARIAMTVTPQGSGSAVGAVSDIQLTGRAAQMGHGVVESVVAQLLGEMSANLERSIGADSTPAGAAPADSAPAGTAPANAASTDAAPAASAAAEPARATPPPAASNDLRAGRLVLAVVRGWFARLFRRGGKQSR